MHVITLIVGRAWGTLGCQWPSTCVSIVTTVAGGLGQLTGCFEYFMRGIWPEEIYMCMNVQM